MTAHGGATLRLQQPPYHGGGTDLTTPTTSSPRTAAQSNDSCNLTNARARARRGIPTTRRRQWRWRRRRASIKALITTELGRRHHCKIWYNGYLGGLNIWYTNLTRGVDLALRSRRFGSDLSTSQLLKLMKTMATPRLVLRLNHHSNSLSLRLTLSTRREQQPLLFRSPKGCVVGEIFDFKHVVELMRFMLTSAVVFLAIHPNNQPNRPN